MARPVDSPFGFRISTFTLQDSRTEGKRGKNSQLHPMGSPAVHGGGVPGLLLTALESIADEKPLRDSSYHQHHLVRVIANDVGETRFILCIVKGGRAGEEFDITTEDGTDEGTVTAEKALTWSGRVLFVIPTGDALHGFIVHETRGASGHGTQTINRLQSWLTAHESIYLSATNDLADSRAWDKVLADDKASIESVEFSTKSEDGGGTAADLNVRRVRMILEMNPAPRLAKKLLRTILNRDGGDSVANLVQGVGGLPLATNFAEGEATAQIRTQRGSRRVKLGRKPYPFTRVIEAPVQVDNHAFIHEVAPDLIDLAAHLNIPLPDPFLPTDNVDKRIVPESSKPHEES